MNFPAALTAAVLLATCCLSRAATLSTTGMAAAGHDIVSWNTWKGQEFTLGLSATASQVIAVTLSLEIPVPNASFVVRVVGSLGTPGRPNMADIRAELRPVGLPSGATGSLFTFEADPLVSFPPLEPEATYWLIAGMTAPDFDQPSPAGLVRWHYAATNGQDAGAESGWMTGPQIAYSDTEGGDWVPTTATPYLFGITAIPVPEAGSLLLLAAANALLLRRRRPS